MRSGSVDMQLNVICVALTDRNIPKINQSQPLPLTKQMRSTKDEHSTLLSYIYLFTIVQEYHVI